MYPDLPQESGAQPMPPGNKVDTGICNLYQSFFSSRGDKEQSRGHSSSVSIFKLM
jgi:hypothetical protein